MPKKTTPKRFPLVWLRLTAYLVDLPEEQLGYVCKDLDKLLDEWDCMDAFGTEGQNDPRGDQRNE